jgi:hypothetical protein
MATSSAMQQPAMPLRAPFAPAAPTMQQPVQPATMQAPQPMMMQAPPVMPVAHPATAMQPTEVQPAVVEESSRPHSLAPEGMGSLLRLDDPSLRDAMDRARDERAGLAVEYRKLTAPLVDIGTSEQSRQEPVQQQPHPDAVLVGHDPNGVPLFAAPDAPMVQPVAHYPGPARIAGASSMPRPVVQAPAGPTDPALTSAAFQRRTPYAPDPALQPALQPALVPATAPVHAPA